MRTLIREFVVLTLLMAAALLPGIAFADEVTGLNTFIGGEPALASEVNDNFTAVKNAVDDNAADITAVGINVDGNASAIAAKQDRVAGSCSAGSSIRSISADGSVVCEADDDGVIGRRTQQG